mmetsp:Transcript_31511/g.31995  ORF Transcript_31511/g.31995 Transcript_31511/m.31995 type:complete len:147 (-) Transcript_31511:109-549(-)
MVESIDDPEHITTNDRTNSDRDLLETAKWTRYLPEAFGIRESVRGSSYRWCVREGGMWGIATATAMSLHRLRAGSKVGFSFQSLLVYLHDTVFRFRFLPLPFRLTKFCVFSLTVLCILPAPYCWSFVFWNLYGGDASIILFLLSTT